MPIKIVREDDDAIIVDVDHCQAPTFGANGFLIRRSALDGLDWKPYFFDIDVFQQAAAAGHNRVAVMRTETRHLFCDSVATFRRKTGAAYTGLPVSSRTEPAELPVPSGAEAAVHLVRGRDRDNSPAPLAGVAGVPSQA